MVQGVMPTTCHLNIMPSLITYERYTEFLSKRISRTITPAELEDITRFEAAQTGTCPKCRQPVRSQFMPSQIAHDIAKCQAESPATTA